MKRTIREWMPLIAIVAVAVPLVIFGLKWHWLPICGYPLPFPLPS